MPYEKNFGRATGALHILNDDKFGMQYMLSMPSVRRGVVVITTAQLHSTKSEIRFCAGSNPARGVSMVPAGNIA